MSWRRWTMLAASLLGGMLFGGSRWSAENVGRLQGLLALSFVALFPLLLPLITAADERIYASICLDADVADDHCR